MSKDFWHPRMDEKGYQPSGISKAEKAARKAYPYDGGTKGWICKSSRPIFIKGYQQAEKDLELTWEDVKRIVEIADSLMPYVCVKQGDLEHNFQTEEDYYKEVLKRYNGKD